MNDITVELREPHIELCALLKIAGLVDSSGQGKRLVADGLVTVDGLAETRKTAKIRAGQTVVCLDARITVSEA